MYLDSWTFSEARRVGTTNAWWEDLNGNLNYLGSTKANPSGISFKWLETRHNDVRLEVKHSMRHPLL